MAIDDRAARQTGGLSVRYEVAGPWAIVAVSGELDYATADGLRDALKAEVLPDGQTHVALDLAELTFCDSMGIGVFVGIRKRLRSIGGRLIMLHTPEFLARRMRQVGLDPLIPSYESLDGM